jgi:hypothetical protein
MELVLFIIERRRINLNNRCDIVIKEVTSRI